MNSMDQPEQNQPSLKYRVLAAARRGDITMRPRWHFVLKGTLIGVGTLLTLLTLLYIASFVVFSLRQTGAWFVPVFGSGGWFAFFRAIPWFLVLFGVLFVALLELLVRRYSFVYRKPLLYALLGMLLVSVAVGVVAAPLHRGLFRAARRSPPPIVGSFYHDLGLQRFPDVHRGVIVGGDPDDSTSLGIARDRSLTTGGSTTISLGGFLIEDPGGMRWTVHMGPRTRLPFGAEFEPGDTVVIFGPEHGGVIEAFGARELVGEEPER